VASDSALLKKKTRIVAGTDLPGVPEGTGGKVGTAIGLTKLVRYRVSFDNGVERMSVVADDLVREDEWDDVKAEREEAERKAAEAPAAAPAAPAESTDGDGDGDGDGAGAGGEAKAPAPVDDRMAALLARSKAAKEKKLAEG
jgi:hypothetical protein